MILVTGANGFVGSATVEELRIRFAGAVRAAVRIPSYAAPPGVEVTQVSGLEPDTDWTAALRDVRTVIHTAARVHVMAEKSADPLAEFRRSNVEATLRLATQAAAAGVSRFIFLSSIKVNGEATAVDTAFTAADTPQPSDAYAVSKFEAESGLRQLSRTSAMEFTIVRPPLIYGPGVKANFLAMMKWLHRGLPLPLSGVHNHRSMVALDNVADLIASCVGNVAAANQTLLVADGEDLSTPQLLRMLATLLGRRARLLPVPPRVLIACASLVGHGDALRRLCSSLRVDDALTRRILSWRPRLSVAEGLRRTVHWYLHEARR